MSRVNIIDQRILQAISAFCLRQSDILSNFPELLLNSKGSNIQCLIKLIRMPALIASAMFYWTKTSSHTVKWFDFTLITVDVFVRYFLPFVFGIELIALTLNVYPLRRGGYSRTAFYLLFSETLIKKNTNSTSDQKLRASIFFIIEEMKAAIDLKKCLYLEKREKLLKWLLEIRGMRVLQFKQ